MTEWNYEIFTVGEKLKKTKLNKYHSLFVKIELMKKLLILYKFLKEVQNHEEYSNLVDIWFFINIMILFFAFINKRQENIRIFAQELVVAIFVFEEKFGLTLMIPKKSISCSIIH